MYTREQALQIMIGEMDCFSDCIDENLLRTDEFYRMGVSKQMKLERQL